MIYSCFKSVLGDPVQVRLNYDLKRLNHNSQWWLYKVYNAPGELQVLGTSHVLTHLIP